jgi:hypothetical protein
LHTPGAAEAAGAAAGAWQTSPMMPSPGSRLSPAAQRTRRASCWRRRTATWSRLCRCSMVRRLLALWMLGTPACSSRSTELLACVLQPRMLVLQPPVRRTCSRPPHSAAPVNNQPCRQPPHKRSNAAAAAAAATRRQHRTAGRQHCRRAQPPASAGAAARRRWRWRWRSRQPAGAADQAALHWHSCHGIRGAADSAHRSSSGRPCAARIHHAPRTRY